eukprot:m.47461 g.47461  ORF g.47461 m.47461 type:complete len:117 (+) comp13227_c0_seq1:409-759(+)
MSSMSSSTGARFVSLRGDRRAGVAVGDVLGRRAAGEREAEREVTVERDFRPRSLSPGEFRGEARFDFRIIALVNWLVAVDSTQLCKYFPTCQALRQSNLGKNADSTNTASSAKNSR